MRMRILSAGAVLALAACGCAHPQEIPQPQPPPPQTSIPQQPMEGEIKTRTASLIHQLASEEYKERERATRLLQNLAIESQDTANLLIKELADTDDPEVEQRLRIVLIRARWHITTALLERIPDITQKLESEDISIRRQAAESLGTTRSEQAIKPPIHLLEDKESTVRRSATQALIQIGGKKIIQPLAGILAHDEDQWVRQDAVDALCAIGGEQVVESLIAALKDKSEYVRVRAIGALRKSKDSRAVIPLCDRLLQDPHDQIRGMAAAALGKIGDRRAVGPLIEACKEPGTIYQYYAALALAELGDEKAVKPLEEAWKRIENNEARIRIAQALANIVGEKAAFKYTVESYSDYRLEKVDKSWVLILIEALSDKHWRIRENAAIALGELRDERAVGPLMKLLKHKDENLRRHASASLRKITKQDFGEDYDKWKEWHEKGGKE